MNRIRPYINRFVKQKELDLTDIYHQHNMKQIKPITTKLMEHSQIYTINHSKQEMIKQARDYEIQRQNKLLLNKIESVISKKGNYSVSKTKSVNTKANKSLHSIYRKKQLQNIQDENKKFLLRLQSKRATVNTLKLMKDWEDNKSVIKRMEKCEFNLTHFKSNKESRIRSLTSQKLYRQKYQDFKLKRYKVINGHKMLIKIEFNGGLLKIVGDSKDHKDLKVIEIPKDEALQFLQKDCDGKVEKILDKLKYDQATETLYLVSQSLEDNSSELNPQGGKLSSEADKYKRQNRSTLQYGSNSKGEDLYANRTITHRINKKQSFDQSYPEKKLLKPSTHENEREITSNKELQQYEASNFQSFEQGNAQGRKQ